MRWANDVAQKGPRTCNPADARRGASSGIALKYSTGRQSAREAAAACATQAH